MLDVRRMRVLREIARHGSFSAAARELSYTQSAVSQHVAALERETGARLVERTGRGVRLTQAGLAGDPCVKSPGWCHCSVIVLRACAAAGFEPHVAFESDDYLAVQGLVAAGLGVALIPELALATVREDIVIRPLGPAPPVRRVVAATSESAYSAPATTAMLDVLSEVAGRLAAEGPALPLAVA